MRLYLSSFRVGNYPERLKELLGKPNAKIGIIMNATDLDSESEIDQKYKEEIERFQPADYIFSRIDLRKFFGKKDQLEKIINDLDCIWVRGGNTFVLRRAMKLSGFDNLIISLLHDDKIVYGGYSAGVVILQKSLRGLDIVDPAEEVPAGYPTGVIWQGLGLLPYNVAVHYKSDHPESMGVDREIEYMEQQKIPYKTLKDGQVIVIDGEKEEFLK